MTTQRMLERRLLDHPQHQKNMKKNVVRRSFRVLYSALSGVQCSCALTPWQQVNDPAFWAGLKQLAESIAPLAAQGAEISRQLQSSYDLSSGAALKEYGLRLCSNPECRMKEIDLPKSKKLQV